MARWTLALLVTLLGAMLTLPAAAQWKWHDKNGHTQYSDLPPPPGVPEHDILSRPASAKARAAAPTDAASAAGGAVQAASATAAASSPLTPKTVDPELEAKRKKAEAEQAAKVKAEEAKVAAQRADNCTRAKAQMRSFDSGVRITRINDKGEREFLDDQQRATEAKRTSDVIAVDCK